LGFVPKGDAGGAGLDALHPGLGVGGALRVDADQVALTQRGEAGLEHLHVAIHAVWVVLPAIDGDGAARSEKAPDQGVAEERGRGQVVNLARDGRAHHQGVDEIVGVVDAQQHGSNGRHPFGVAHVDRPKQEPQPEARDQAHGCVEGVGAI
jgi:hypothetical protein